MPAYHYDSISKNPAPNVEKKIDRGHAGMLVLDPGDYVPFVCDVMNRTDDRLRFANELSTGAMCIVFGSYTGGRVCGQPVRAMG